MAGIFVRPTTGMPRRAAAWAVVLWALLAATAGRADVADLRITEVDPYHQQIEVTNVNGGSFMLSGEIPIPYNFDFNNTKRMGIVPGFIFMTGSILVVPLPDMHTYASDCWLYSSEAFDNPGSVIHGVQFGTPPAGRRNAEIAALAGKWPDKNASAPMPPPGCTLAWDGDGNTPLDWYVDSTPSMGQPNTTVAGSVDEPFPGPQGQQGFETPALGDQVTALKGWTMSGVGTRFNARFVADVNGQSGARPGSLSRHWLRIRDTDATGDNALWSPPVQFGAITGYRLACYLNQETTPTATGAARPALVVQIATGPDQWADAWAIRFKDGGVEAAVLAAGGVPSATPLYDLRGATGVGQWVKVELVLDLAGGTLLASVNGAKPVPLPISPAGDPLKLRLAYQGGGSGNTQDLLLDDIELAPWTEPQNAAAGWAKYQ